MGRCDWSFKCLLDIIIINFIKSIGIWKKEFHLILLKNWQRMRYLCLVVICVGQEETILEDHNSHKVHNTEGNFLPFKEEFQC